MIAPIGVGENGETYNINADVVAGKVAETLKAEKLVLLTNTPGVLDKAGKVITNVTPTTDRCDGCRRHPATAACCRKSARPSTRPSNGVKSVHIIDGRVEHALLLEILTSHGVGTMIRSN